MKKLLYYDAIVHACHCPHLTVDEIFLLYNKRIQRFDLPFSKTIIESALPPGCILQNVDLRIFGKKTT